MVGVPQCHGRVASPVLHKYFHFYFIRSHAAHIADRVTLAHHFSRERPLAQVTQAIPYAHRHRTIVVVLGGEMDEAAVARRIDRR